MRASSPVQRLRAQLDASLYPPGAVANPLFTPSVVTPSSPGPYAPYGLPRSTASYAHATPYEQRSLRPAVTASPARAAAESASLSDAGLLASQDVHARSSALSASLGSLFHKLESLQGMVAASAAASPARSAARSASPPQPVRSYYQTPRSPGPLSSTELLSSPPPRVPPAVVSSPPAALHANGHESTAATIARLEVQIMKLEAANHRLQARPPANAHSPAQERALAEERLRTKELERKVAALERRLAKTEPPRDMRARLEAEFQKRLDTEMEVMHGQHMRKLRPLRAKVQELTDDLDTLRAASARRATSASASAAAEADVLRAHIRELETDNATLARELAASTALAARVASLSDENAQLHARIAELETSADSNLPPDVDLYDEMGALLTRLADVETDNNRLALELEHALAAKAEAEADALAYNLSLTAKTTDTVADTAADTHSEATLVAVASDGVSADADDSEYEYEYEEVQVGQHDVDHDHVVDVDDGEVEHAPSPAIQLAAIAASIASPASPRETQDALHKRFLNSPSRHLTGSAAIHLAALTSPAS
ncbi:uncharacterized protein AMSG_04848 [Thecamonas trahens ATCC 50062]|uniref:Uncharacterized protein n=1 Tax=Thecamonas trahens ATCC 50062 TaxID=461836 RepID=A0A0L0D7R5_THETB|nr:hypothetical protein AMSG_04848 [Thecamonas trahens ATCC 50062]KNC48399.1 hypothetical protein AMSG_04848 [Thecamonas trahens ATCC 50062]|eukprot:XP_013758516.1 hypothetical protein AMSG_04848 [Thecamonas trahens ATCC 50062]